MEGDQVWTKPQRFFLRTICQTQWAELMEVSKEA